MPDDYKGVSACILKLDGQTAIQASSGQGGGGGAEAQGHWFLESVQVDRQHDCPDMFTVELDIRSGAEIQVLDDLKEGQEVEILMGPMGQEKPVFKGEIHYIEPHFRHRGKSTVSVGGYDKTHRLTRGTTSRTWGDGIQSQDLKASAMQDVIDKAGSSTGASDGLSADQVKKSKGPKAAYVPQLNVSDYQMLRAMQTDLDATQVAGNPVVVLVRDAAHSQDEVVVHEARFSLSTVSQVSKVEVRGWDPKAKKAIVGTATAPDHTFGGTPGHEATGKALYGNASTGKVLTIVDRPVDSKEEAESIAKAIFDKLAMDFVTGEVDFHGDPRIKPGDLVELKQFGTRFSGKYLVRRVTHLMMPRSLPFTTRIQIARSDIGS